MTTYNCRRRHTQSRHIDLLKRPLNSPQLCFVSSNCIVKSPWEIAAAIAGVSVAKRQSQSVLNRKYRLIHWMTLTWLVSTKHTKTQLTAALEKLQLTRFDANSLQGRENRRRDLRIAKGPKQSLGSELDPNHPQGKYIPMSIYRFPLIFPSLSSCVFLCQVKPMQTVEVALHIYLATGKLKRLGQATGSHAFTVSASPAVSSSWQSPGRSLKFLSVFNLWP